MVLKVGEQRKISILPEEGPPDLGRSSRKDKNGLSPKLQQRCWVMDRGSKDFIVVIVKLLADENMVTYLRVKLRESDMEVGDEG